jgi:hypothetical protein
MYALSTSVLSENRTASSDPNLHETNWHADVADSQRFNRNLGKRTGRYKPLKANDIILNSREMFIPFNEPSMICHPRPVAAETKWRAHPADKQGLNQSLSKRTGRPNPHIQQDLILKNLNSFIRCAERSPINHQPSVRAQTNPNEAKPLKPCILKEMSRKFRKRSQSTQVHFHQAVTRKKRPFFGKNECMWTVPINELAPGTDQPKGGHRVPAGYARSHCLRGSRRRKGASKKELPCPTP